MVAVTTIYHANKGRTESCLSPYIFSFFCFILHIKYMYIHSVSMLSHSMFEFNSLVLYYFNILYIILAVPPEVARTNKYIVVKKCKSSVSYPLSIGVEKISYPEWCLNTSKSQRIY